MFYSFLRIDHSWLFFPSVTLSILLAYLLAYLLACLLTCLLTSLLACFVACLLSCLLACLVACLLTCLLTSIQSIFMVCFAYPVFYLPLLLSFNPHLLPTHQDTMHQLKSPSLILFFWRSSFLPSFLSFFHMLPRNLSDKVGPVTSIFPSSCCFGIAI